MKNGRDDSEESGKETHRGHGEQRTEVPQYKVTGTRGVQK